MENNHQQQFIKRFRNKLLALAPLPENDYQQLAQAMHEVHFDKGEVILREGLVCEAFYFIMKGCIRSFCIKDGEEVNIDFYFEDDIASDFISLRDEKPSEICLVAMEECLTYAGFKKEVSPVFFGAVPFYIVLFRFFQDLYFKKEQHANSFKLLAPKERYLYLLTNYPKYVQRIPGTYLASYLGISLKTLSRIRKEINQQKN